MAQLSFGWIPLPMTINLRSDSDFFTELINDAGPYPPGTELTFRFSIPDEAPIEWEATIVDNAARWFRPKAEIAELVDLEPSGVKLRYKGELTEFGEVDMTWYEGEANVST